MHWIFKVHLILGLTIFLVFPFTRLVHMLSAPIWYMGRRGWQLVRTRRDISGDKAKAAATAARRAS
nr:respiratory nitrate reductase subunit gamma [Hankyongella ginsenosidimutans]